MRSVRERETESMGERKGERYIKSERHIYIERYKGLEKERERE